jgi:DNA-binding response OmpR family regulator
LLNFEPEVLKVPGALVVEGDVVLRNIVRSVLTSQGFEVLDAANAGEAVMLCESSRDPSLDLLIIDHHLPGLERAPGSRAVGEQIMRLSPGIKVLVISECPYTVVSKQDGLPEGAWFLQKPFTVAQLAEMIRNILRPRIQ